jgi:hypothetical protein
MKRKYEKPTLKVYELQRYTPIVCASELGGDNSFNWGNPLEDR